MKISAGVIGFFNVTLILSFAYFFVFCSLDVHAFPRGGVSGGRGGGGGGGGGSGGRSVGVSSSTRYRGGGYYHYSGGNLHKGFFFGLTAGAAVGAATVLGLDMVLNGEVLDLSQISQPLSQLVEVVRMIKDNKISELENLLTTVSCEAKAQWKDCALSDDVSSLFGVKQSSVMSTILVSMIDCPAALVHATRAKNFLGIFSTTRLRDITEVLVTISETADLHDGFIKEYDADTGSGVADIRYSLENNEDIGLEYDIENVCFELINRKRTNPAAVDVQAVAENLKNESNDGWDDDRQTLDWTMMELSFEEILKIFDKFKTINNEISIDDEFSKNFEDDTKKLTIYRQLLALARNKIAYLTDEIQTRISDNQEWSLPFANTLAMLGTLSKDERDKVDAEYKNRNNGVTLMEQMDKMVSTSGFEDTILQVHKYYLEKLRDRTN